MARLRDEAGKLRDARPTRRVTLFMLFTGPLMVLAVLAAAWWGRRWWQARGMEA